jgi:anti-anti-sigma factor
MSVSDQHTELAPATVVALSGELDASDGEWADSLKNALTDGDGRIVVDMHDVTFIDSSVVRELVLAHRRIPMGGWIHLVYTHHLIHRVLDICGIADLFPQFTTVDAAIRDAPTRHLAPPARENGATHGHPSAAPVSRSTETDEGPRP